MKSLYILSLVVVLLGLTGVAHAVSTSIAPEPVSSTLFILGGVTLAIRRMRKK